MCRTDEFASRDAHTKLHPSINSTNSPWLQLCSLCNVKRTAINQFTTSASIRARLIKWEINCIEMHFNMWLSQSRFSVSIRWTTNGWTRIFRIQCNRIYQHQAFDRIPIEQNSTIKQFYRRGHSAMCSSGECASDFVRCYFFREHFSRFDFW